MPFILQVDNLSEQAVQAAADQIQAYASQLVTNADFSKGTVLYDLLIRPAAVLQTLAEINVNRARLAGSLLSISQFPEVADNDMVNELLSNYRITRQGGTIAGGSVEIKISSNTITAVPSGSAFVSGGLRFFTNQAYVGVPSQSMVVSTSDRLIKQLADGVWAFQVEVTAEATGSAYQLSQGTTIVMQNPPSNYISSTAAYDFSAGIGAETNAEIIARMPAGLSNRTPGNRSNIEALLRDNLDTIKNVSIMGYGQAEMTRDQDNLFLFSYGGKSDVYVQTVLRPQLVRVTKQALLVNSTGTWQMFFTRDEFAGVYQLSAVLPTDLTNVQGTLKVTMEARAIDVSGTNVFVPHVDNFMQIAFSRYQTLTIEFLDPYTSTTGLTPRTSTKDYYVDLLVMPHIAQLQDEVLSNPELRAHRYDDIVRAPIPVLVSLNFGLRLRNGDNPDLTAMRQAIADRINQLGFRSSLSSSYVSDTAHDLMGSKSSVILPVDMIGELVDPVDGSSRIFRSGTELVIPTDYTREISANTLMFFCDPNNISIYTERS